MTLQKTSELDSDGVTSSLLASHLANISPNEYVNYGNVTAMDVMNAAKASLAALPSYVVVGKTAGTYLYRDVMNKLH